MLTTFLHEFLYTLLEQYPAGMILKLWHLKKIGQQFVDETNCMFCHLSTPHSSFRPRGVEHFCANIAGIGRRKTGMLKSLEQPSNCMREVGSLFLKQGCAGLPQFA